MTKEECIALAEKTFQTTKSLLKEDAKLYAKLTIKAFNNERDLYSDDYIDEHEFYKRLGELDQRFKDNDDL